MRRSGCLHRRLAAMPGSQRMKGVKLRLNAARAGIGASIP